MKEVVDLFNNIKNKISTEVVGMNIGSNISALRKEMGITQEELANVLGVSAQAVSKWENNSSCPDVSLLTNIADYFSVTVDDLLRADENEIITGGANSSKNSAYTQNNNKKSIHINVVQQNGKENTIKIPFKFAKIGIDIGTMFGLDKSVADKISTLVSGESITDIIDVCTENGEHITITLV